MKHKQIRLQNRAFLLYRLILLDALIEWQEHTTSSLVRIFRNKIKDLGFKTTEIDIKSLFKNVVIDAISSLSRQGFVYLNETWNNFGFDGSMNKDAIKFKNLKHQIDVDGKEKTTNAPQLLKIIRDAFAHNNDLINKHWYTDGECVFIKSKKDKNGNEHNIKMKFEDLSELSLLYFQNMQNNYHFELDINEEVLKTRLINNSLDISNVEKIFQYSFTTLKNKDDVIDIYQRQSIVNLFKNFNVFFRDDNFKNCEEKFIGSILPFKDNSYYNLCDICLTISMMSQLLNNFTSYESYLQGLSKNCNNDKGEIQKVKFMILSQKFYSVIINNCLFSMFSFGDIDMINKNMPIESNTNKIRNSIMHGRYHYNYNSVYSSSFSQAGFEFYDFNNKNLEHIGTLSNEKIYSIFYGFLKNYQQEVDEYIKEKEGHI